MLDPTTYAGQIIHGVLLLLAIVNPLGSIPMYVDLTKGMGRAQRVRTINLAVLIAFSMVALFTLLGDWGLKHIFEVTVDEFRIAGGLLLFMIAQRGVLQSGEEYNLKPGEEHFIAIFPLAFPLIVGPGSLTLTIILAQRFGIDKMLIITVVSAAITLLLARTAHGVMKIMGPFAGQVIARLLYLFLAAKAVAMVLAGLANYWKALPLG